MTSSTKQQRFCIYIALYNSEATHLYYSIPFEIILTDTSGLIKNQTPL